jgi:hypothetical protein
MSMILMATRLTSRTAMASKGGTPRSVVEH